MKVKGLLALALLACAALVAPVAAAGATEVIGELGRPGADCKTVGEDSIFLQAYFADTTGTIIEWSFQTGDTVPGPGTKLKVVAGGVSGFYTVVGEAAVGPMVPEALNNFDVEIPISKGDRLGLYTGKPSTGQCFRGDSYSAGAEIHGDVPVGSSAGSSGLKTGYHAPITAVILPPPVLSAVSPASVLSGGTEVTISGENLRRVKSVTFGSVPAVSFREVGEGELEAVAPASAVGTVDVQVTTAAGTTPLVPGDRFTYSAPPSQGGGGGAGDGGGGSGAGSGGAGALPKPASPAPVGPPAVCKVPSLRGRKLPAARKAIRAAGCRLGRPRMARHQNASTGTVKSQTPKPGRSVPVGTKITVKLG